MKKYLKYIISCLILSSTLIGIISPKTHAKTTYYGNGVYCSSVSQKCWVDWGKTANCIGNISVASWAGATIAKC